MNQKTEVETLNWMKEHGRDLVNSGLLNNSIPLPFNQIEIHTDLEDGGENKTKIVLIGETFKEWTLKLFCNDIIQFSLQVIDLQFITNDLEQWCKYNLKIKSYVEHIYTKEESNEICSSCVSAVYNIMAYIMFHKEDVKIEKTVRSHNKNNHKKSTKKKRKVYLERHYKLIGKNKPDNPKKRIFGKESWTVRGHMRRYKSGKVVFVKPHVKGSGIKKDIEYVL